MELDTLAGLPAHPLLVHVPVVMLPLAAIGAVLIALRQSWLERFGWWVVGFAGVGFIGAVLAAGSGEALEERVNETAALEEHAEMGETARLMAFIFFLVVAAVVGYRWWMARKQQGRRPGQVVAIVSSVLLIATAVGATATVATAGHQGAELTWGDLEGSGESGDRDGDRDEDSQQGDQQDNDSSTASSGTGG